PPSPAAGSLGDSGVPPAAIAKYCKEPARTPALPGIPLVGRPESLGPFESASKGVRALRIARAELQNSPEARSKACGAPRNPPRARPSRSRAAPNAAAAVLAPARGDAKGAAGSLSGVGRRTETSSGAPKEAGEARMELPSEGMTLPSE